MERSDDDELAWGTPRRVDVDGIGFATESAGPDPGDAQGPTLLGLHGFASGTFTWAGLAPLLAGARRFGAWDRPPFGASDRPEPGRGATDPYGPDRRIAQTAGLVARLAPDGPPVLIGHSAGALAAVEAVAAGAIDVAGLVLLAPALAGAPPAPIRRLARLPGAERWGPTGVRLALLAAEPALRSAGRHPSPLTTATAAATARSLRQPGTAAALWHLTRTWAPTPLDDRIGALGVPMLVVGGADDRIVSPASLEATAASLGAEYVSLDGVGHAPQEQVPGIVADHVGSFLAGLSTA